LGHSNDLSRLVLVILEEGLDRARKCGIYVKLRYCQQFIDID